jgi:enoyl-CoA hydratase/carnithine racemase
VDPATAAGGTGATDTGGAEADAGRLGSSVEDGIGWIVFDNPAKHNAMTADMFAALPRLCETVAGDPTVRVVVLRGAGDRAFVSGADLAQLDREIRPEDPAGSAAGDPRGLVAIDKPVLAMIHGYCLGAGVALALGADVRICADDAEFGIPAAKLGIAYPYEATALLVAAVGPAHAAAMLYTGRRFDAAEAVRIGLVNQRVPKSELDETVRTLAAGIAANAPMSHAAHKRSISAATRRDGSADRAAVEAAITAAWSSEDFVEGRQAFAQQRPPRFAGR